MTWSLPDGLDPEDDKNDQIKVLFSIKSTMPEKLHKLIEDINAVDGENKISCIVVSVNTGWALEVGQKLGIKGAVLFPGSATSLGSCECIPRLIDEGIIDFENGTLSNPSPLTRTQMGSPHVLVIPYPILGILNPLMQFSQVLAKHGCKITFVNTEFSHQRLKNASEGQENSKTTNINLVSLPDGLDPEDDRKDLMKVMSSIRTTMPAKLQKLIEDINATDAANKISCIVVSMNSGWALEVGHKLGIKGALFATFSATSLATCDSIQRLIDDGIINSENGFPIKNHEIQLSPNMPMIDPSNLSWCSLGKIFFDHVFKEMQTMKLGEWWLCNTSYELEPGAFSMSPKFLPIGPIIASDQNTSSFWQEDITCLDWLNQQPPQSVIYVSFGSLAVMDPNQFKELALALEILNKPFLWVVRPDNDNKLKNSYPDEFQGTKGKIVSWAPQKRILSHPALACFISHCGWNSTIEGLCGGVPFLCWPFFTDQFLNRQYICDVWKVGLGFEKDENGVISRDEIKNKVEQVFGDKDIKARALKLKEVVMNSIAEDGHSSKNINMFINWAKE